MWGISLELFHARGSHVGQLYKGPHDALVLTSSAGTTPTTTSTKFCATRCYRSWAMPRRRDAWQMPKQWNWYGMYTWYIHITAWHMIYHIIYLSIYLPTYLPIYLSICLSIYPSIHPSTHIHTVNIIAGRFFVWWLVLFLHTVVSIWRYLWSFFYGGIQLLHIIVYHSVIWDHEVDKNSSQSVINH